MNDAIVNLRECAAIRATGLNDYRSVNQDKAMADTWSATKASNFGPQYKQKQLYQLPYFNGERFVGRDDVLSRIATALDPSDPPQQKYFTIWGLGGIGKSQTALSYAHRSISKFDASFWVRAETEASLHQSFTDFALNLDLPGASRSNSHEENRDCFHSWLLLSGKLVIYYILIFIYLMDLIGFRWLMIFDNIDDIDRLRLFWPSSDGSFLSTTRRSSVAAAARGTHESKLAIKPMGLPEARELFISLMKDCPERTEWLPENPLPEQESEAGDTLLNLLGGLPLGIRQSAALIKVKRLKVSNFLKRYQKAAGDTTKFFRKGDKSFSFDQDYPLALDTVWRMSFESLQVGEDSSAYNLLAFVSLCSPDIIPEEIFHRTKFEYPAWLDFCNGVDNDE